MILRYHSWLPSQLKTNSDVLDISNITPLYAIYEMLEERGGRYKEIFKHKNVIFAHKNGLILSLDDPIVDGDVLEIFSPIAGG